MDFGHVENGRLIALAVDDELANLSTLQRVFRRDFDLTLCQRPEEGVELLRKRSFDLALVDYTMPVLNGVEFLRHAADIQPTMARLLVTAHQDLTEVRAALAGGIAVGVIAKPWKRDDILHWAANLRRVALMRDSVAKLTKFMKA